MYCIQCEQTMKTPVGNGCSYSQGMCGKTAETSDLQDLLIAMLESLSTWAVKARELSIIDNEIDAFTAQAFFSTLTNVNFDSQRIIQYAQQAESYRNQLIQRCRAINPSTESNHPKAHLTLNGNDITSLTAQSEDYALNKDINEISEEVHGLRMLCLYGLKGAAAYMEHAHVLGQYDNQVYLAFHQYMSWLGTDPTDIDTLLEQALGIGTMNFNVMGLLDQGETASFGHPTPSSVNIKPIAGKCILISGHDLQDLKALLEQTEGSGINIYTHGEMLPAHGYPELNKYTHLVGNYGGGWQNQQREFAKFPGPIIMTSNCIIDPTIGKYADRIYTRSIVGWPGVTHLDQRDFSQVIKQAQQMPGFPYSEIEHNITVGFGRQTLLDASDAVIDLVAEKKLRHVFLIGGCDGSVGERSYYTEFARNVPKDCVVLTLGCGKYRFNKLEFGTLEGGLPRLLDVGQCNDAYSAIMLAVKLAEKLGCGVNDLPLTLVLSWFEQKAIVILLTLLALGVKDIYTGPTAPAFLNDNLLAILNEKFGLRGLNNPQQDMQQALSK